MIWPTLVLILIQIVVITGTVFLVKKYAKKKSPKKPTMEA